MTPDRDAPQFFEDWARKNNMRPVGRFRCDDGDILIADSDEPFFGQTETGVSIKFWRTGFSIFRDKNWIASTHDTMVDELCAYTSSGAKNVRVNEALEYGKYYLQLTLEAGLYDDDHSFSKILH